MEDERLRRIMSAVASGLDVFAGGASGTERMVAQAASGLIRAAAAATEHRSPDDVRRLLLELGQSPAPKLADDVSTDDEHVDAMIARMRKP